MTKSSIMIDLDDPRTSRIADVISNKTCKKILSLLAEEQLSEGDIASRLSLPLNTVGYNVKKLVEAGLVEPTKEFFWSVKGKKVPTYTVSNKKIVISPQKLTRGVIPALVTAGLAAIGIKIFSGNGSTRDAFAYSSGSAGSGVAAVAPAVAPESAKIAADIAVQAPNTFADGGATITAVASSTPHAWAWFLLGGLLTLAVMLSWSYFKK